MALSFRQALETLKVLINEVKKLSQLLQLLQLDLLYWDTSISN